MMAGSLTFEGRRFPFGAGVQVRRSARGEGADVPAEVAVDFRRMPRCDKVAVTIAEEEIPATLGFKFDEHLKQTLRISGQNVEGMDKRFPDRVSR